MSISKTIQVGYFSSISGLTIDVFDITGVTEIASGLTLTETATGSMTYNSSPLTAVVTLGTYRIVIRRSGSEIGYAFCDLNEVVGLYPCYDGPTPQQIVSELSVSPIANVISVIVTPAMAQAALHPNLINCVRGDSLENTMTLGAVNTWSTIYFTVKKYATDPDSAAMIQIVAVSGGGSSLVTFLGAAAANPTHGTLVVTDGSVGTVQIYLAATETAQLPIANWFWDAQVIYPSGIVYTPITNGKFNVTMDITQATS